MKKKTFLEKPAYIFSKKAFLIFQEAELSYISRVVKTKFLILLVLRDNNSCFLSQESPAGFFIFHLFEVFRFSLSRLFPCFTFLGYFQVSPFSGVFIFHLSRVFWFFTFLGCFHFSSFSGISFFNFLRCFCVAAPPVLRIWESIFYSQVLLPDTPSRHLEQPAFFSRIPWEPAVLPWSLQDLSLMFETQTRSICLFESHSVHQKLYRTLYQLLPNFEPAFS